MLFCIFFAFPPSSQIHKLVTERGEFKVMTVSLKDFKGKNTAFVSDWLRKKG